MCNLKSDEGNDCLGSDFLTGKDVTDREHLAEAVSRRTFRSWYSENMAGNIGTWSRFTRLQRYMLVEREINERMQRRIRLIFNAGGTAGL